MAIALDSSILIYSASFFFVFLSITITLVAMIHFRFSLLLFLQINIHVFNDLNHKHELDTIFSHVFFYFRK